MASKRVKSMSMCDVLKVCMEWQKEICIVFFLADQCSYHWRSFLGSAWRLHVYSMVHLVRTLSIMRVVMSFESRLKWNFSYSTKTLTITKKISFAQGFFRSPKHNNCRKKGNFFSYNALFLTKSVTILRLGFVLEHETWNRITYYTGCHGVYHDFRILFQHYPS